jgi:UDP-N-acetylglucosamine:LPS N-acetylglucosamine transferase
MKTKPRVLLLSASSGAGHIRAAQALERAFTARGDCVVEHIDTIRYVSKLFQRIYDKAYISMVRRVPELMGVIYDRTDQPWNQPRRRLAMDRLNTQPMVRMLKRMQPDLCVATHFLPAEIIAWLITKGKLRARHAIVVTDYDVHALWLCHTVDRYYVALPESAEYIARIGVPRETLRITGIPIDPVFAAPVDRASARRHLKLDAEALAVLVSAGGEGVGPIAAIVRDLLAMKKPWQIVAIAGKAEKNAPPVGRTRRHGRYFAERISAPHPRRVHYRNGSIHGRRGPARRQSWRAHHIRSIGASAAHGVGRADSRPGRAQFRSFAGSRRRDPLQQSSRGGLENRRVA